MGRKEVGRDIQLTQWMIDLLNDVHDRAFEVMVDQMSINPDAIEALYGD
jgi:hypothetical protein